MEFKRIGAAAAIAALVMFPLAACGSTPAPSVTTVTATTPTYPTYSSPCPLGDGFDRCIDTRRAERQAADAAKQTPAAAPPQAKSSGLPWWAWMVIVPGGAIGLLVLGFKVLEWNDDRTIARAEARVDELDARAAQRASRVLDYDEWDDEEDAEDELPEEDIAFLHRVTDPTPSAPAQPTQPTQPASGGSLLSSLRQQRGAR
ncbi:hypothetical protein [Mycobacteroides abscessus]|uniref:hypothetical protein n=1 Tax=Mycobacteroides abscessus TaxID=36809 RepID=UPI0009A615FE|nr:hypothetical protein [Mycobacteroides abscessus]SKO98069.1 putative lipoprotein [Mycobacteroides abscessus subsp. abscessus]